LSDQAASGEPPKVLHARRQRAAADSPEPLTSTSSPHQWRVAGRAPDAMADVLARDPAAATLVVISIVMVT